MYSWSVVPCNVMGILELEVPFQFHLLHNRIPQILIRIPSRVYIAYFIPPVVLSITTPHTSEL